MPFVRADQDIAQAWYLLGFARTEHDKRLYAFQQVLRIDPSSASAQKQITKLLADPAQTAPGEKAAVSKKSAPRKRTNPVWVWYYPA